jgi:hypothetical protein
MGYFMRYFIPQSAEQVSLSVIREALTAIDPHYTIQIDPTDTYFGDLYYGERNLGEIEINRVGDDIFQEEIDDFLDLLAYSQDPQKAVVINTLKTAGQMVAISAIWRDGDVDDADAVHDRIDPLWEWLDNRYQGMLHCDGDGFYHGDSLILEMTTRI